ncbi:uncharacterized protein LOC131943502 [Physella acuta]|uniref:uncharacterized protein LOC131943502 n=1 Tax=Physella acuta TaxID=109671 RepID=UPI0027DD62DF|nr:uncharacterized protein LOC131943502 [Physella acuta]
MTPVILLESAMLSLQSRDAFLRAVIGALVVMATSDALRNCSFEGAFRSLDVCYVFYLYPVSWQESQKICIRDGMLLARFNDVEQIRSIMAMAIQEEGDYIAWIGASDLATEGKFTWLDSRQTMTGVVWRDNEPDHLRGENCVCVDVTSQAYDETCSEEQHFICMMIDPQWSRTEPVSQCHCATGLCPDDGQCPYNRCQRGWFGNKCQFRDAACSSPDHLTLTDGDDATCLSGSSQPLKMTFFNQTVIVWLRVVLLRKVTSLDKLTITFGLSTQRTVCDKTRVLHVEGTSYDVYCHGGPHYADHVIIKADSSMRLCSVHMHSGVNLGQLSGTVSPSVQSPDVTVDGEWGEGVGCMTSGGDHNTSDWEVTFDKEVVIHEIVIRRTLREGGHHFMDGFQIEALDTHSRPVFLHVDQDPDSPNSVHVFTRTQSPVVKVKISMPGPALPEKFLEICEIEIYGDCAPPHYGLTCEHVCGACPHKMCHYNGDCVLRKEPPGKPDPGVKRMILLACIGVTLVAIVASSYFCCRATDKYSEHADSVQPEEVKVVPPEPELHEAKGLKTFRSDTDVDTGKSTTTLPVEKSGTTVQTGSDDSSVLHFLKVLHAEESRTTASTSTTSVSTQQSQPSVTPAANRPPTPAVSRTATPAVNRDVTPAANRTATPAVTPAANRTATPAVNRPTTPASNR